MRLFAALPVAAGARRAIRRDLGDLPERSDRWRWTSADGWHVTLAFLGEVDDGALDDVARALRAAAAAAPSTIGLHTGPAQVRDRRLLWLPLVDEPRGAVAALGARLQRALAEADLPVDRRDVAAHLTLARARGRGRAAASSLPPALPHPRASWTVDRVVVYRSVLGEGPARYEPVASTPLASTPAAGPRLAPEGGAPSDPATPPA